MASRPDPGLPMRCYDVLVTPHTPGTVLQPTIRDEELQGNRQLVVVVRLMLDGGWDLLHGELVDVDERSRGRFAGWAELTPAVRRYVDEERRTTNPASAD